MERPRSVYAKIPAGTYAGLERLAELHDRSIHWWVKRLLEEGVAARLPDGTHIDTSHVAAADDPAGVYSYGSDTVGATGHA